MVEDWNNFLRLMYELKLYTVEFEEYCTIKPKKYPSDFAVRGEKRRPIIVINNNECIFSSNNGVRRAWRWIDDTFLQPKRQSQDIMTLEFLLLFDQLNLDFFSSEKHAESIKKTALNMTEEVKVFEYRKNNEGY